MSSKNDPAGGSQDGFLDNHDKWLASLSNPQIAALLSPADQATLAADNTAMHQTKSAFSTAEGAMQQATKNKTNAFDTGTGNYRAIRQRFTKAAGYTPALGELAGVERSQSVTASEMSADGPQPVLPTGGAEIKSNKGEAEAVDLYSQRDGDADFVFLMRVLHFPYVDNRPLLAAGKPEKREYRALFIRQNKPYGNLSAVITVVVTA